MALLLYGLDVRRETRDMRHETCKGRQTTRQRSRSDCLDCGLAAPCQFQDLTNTMHSFESTKPRLS